MELFKTRMDSILNNFATSLGSAIFLLNMQFLYLFFHINILTLTTLSLRMCNVEQRATDCVPIYQLSSVHTILVHSSTTSFISHYLWK